MADYDLTTLDETKPNGNIEEIAGLDEYQRETRKKLKAWVAVEHDPITGAHIIPHGPNLPPGTPAGNLAYHDTQRELIIASGGFWRSVAQPTFNYLINGMFNQFWTAPTVGFSGWDFSGTGAVLTSPGVGIYGTNCARIRAIVDYAVLGQTIASSAGSQAPFAPYTYWKDKTVTFGAFVRTSSAGNVYLRIHDGIAYSNSPFHPGDGLWHWLSITKRVSLTSTFLRVEVASVALSINVFICGATLVEGHSCPHPLPPSWQGRQGTLHFGSADPQPNTSTPWWYGSSGHNLTVSSGNFLPFDALARNFLINAVSGVGAGTLTAQVEYGGILTPLLVSITGAVNAGSDMANGYFGSKFNSWSVKVIRAGGSSDGFFASLTYDEVPSYP